MFVVNGPIGQVGPTVPTSSSHASFAPDTGSARETPSDIALPRPIMASDAASKASKATSQKDNASDPEQSRSSRIGLLEGIGAQSIFEAIVQPKQDSSMPSIQDIANRYVEAISSQIQSKQSAPTTDPKMTTEVSAKNLLDSTNPFERSNMTPNPIDLRF
ncbi:MAG: hypothetical protein ABJD13_08700 [Paracoccaceae bacterium]